MFFLSGSCTHLDNITMAHLLALRQSFALCWAPSHDKITPIDSRSLTSPLSLSRKSAICRSQAFGETLSPKSVGEIEQQFVPVLSTDEVISKLQANVLNSTHHKPYRAMYSSILGGITTDPAMMLIPLDDHMVHRGHGVFDTALILKGYLYELDEHLDRILRSASMARITAPFSRQTLRNILVETTAASHCKDGSLRYWLSAGPGGFSLSCKQCTHASFYAIVLDYEHEPSEAVTVVTSSIPMKSPLFATMKNVNYLPNALSLMEAEEKGAFAGIWVDDEGYVAEGPNMNVAFVNQEGELVMPAFDKVLSGCTAKRTLALAHELVDESKQQSGQLRSVKVGLISVEEGKNASEMMLIGSGLPIVPVVQWDEQQIGNGKPGPITLALQALVREDMLNGPLTHREPVPYKGGK